MVELVVVMIVIGILSAVAIPRMDASAFKERGFRDAVFTAVTHARRVAMASRRFVCVTVVEGTGSGATVSMTRDVGTSPETATDIDCTQNVSLPSPTSGCASNAVCAPSGVTLGGASSVIFDPLGRSVSVVSNPGPPATKTITISSASITISNQDNVTVAGETGYVQ